MARSESRRSLLRGAFLVPSALLKRTSPPASPEVQEEFPVGIGQPQPDVPARTLFLPDGIPMDLEIQPSPSVTPFVMDLPIPPIAIPVRGTNGSLETGHESLTDPYGNPAPKDIVNPTPVYAEGKPDPRTHQQWASYVPKKYYQVNISQFFHNYHDELTALSPGGLGTATWGYGGSAPGPTFIVFYGEPILVRMANALPDCSDPVQAATLPPFGVPSTSTHLHNAHTPSESDGFPMDFIDPGQWHDHHYVNIPAGSDWRERMTSLWYHDHRMDFTAPNVYAGLTGFYFYFDDPADASIPDNYKDTGDEEDAGTLRLPGKFVRDAMGNVTGRLWDIPLMLHDVLFDQEGQAVFDVFNTDGILGDRFTVNRTVQPKLTVERRRYRLRIQNGGPSRFYDLHLTDQNGVPIPGLQFWVLSSDGNLLPKPLPKDSIQLSVAQRHDVIVDFSLVPAGTTEVYLYNALEQIHGRGPTGRNLLEIDPNVNRDALMRFDLVAASAADPSADPATITALREMPDDRDDLERLRFQVTTATPSDYTTDSVQVPTVGGGMKTLTRKYLQWVDGNGMTQNVYVREFVFDYDGGLWTINGMAADMTEIPIVVDPGAHEVWHIKNSGGDWSHPVHIHFEEFRLIEFNGLPISDDDPRDGRKDVLTIGPGEDGIAFFRFRDFEGHYIIHCHNVIHEDHAMMLRWNIGLNRDVGHHSDPDAARWCNGVYIPQPVPTPRED
ncbi:MAG TPA: copper oxidase [Planctomycetes bacterium]|nr:copper oxidase [Planctomycetota bacterium]